MKALTQRMLVESGINIEQNPAIVALCEFVSQRSGIEPGNYYSDWRDKNGREAYQNEIKDIGQDLRRFRTALNVAGSEGVTDKDVIAEAPNAFSGRLEWVSTIKLAAEYTEGIRMLGAALSKTARPWEVASITADIDSNRTALGKKGDWRYTTGQYFPTEYRKAAATLIEYATRRVRQARPKETAERITTIAQLKALNQKNGNCWFDKSSMSFFGTKIESEVIQGEYFITSDKRGFDDDLGRGFTIRRFNLDGSIRREIGELGQYDSKSEALSALLEHLKS